MKAPASDGVRYKGNSQRRLPGDQEFQGFGDDFKFDGEAGEGFAIDLGVNGLIVNGHTEDRVGFVKVDVFLAAEFVEVERAEVAQVAEATAGGQG